MNINLNLLKYFYEVVKEKNITKAAEKAYITQPAMTRAIKDLETQLNTKLLERSQKGVTPTNEGLILFDHIENIFREINITKDIIENSNDINELYIGTTTSNYFNILIKKLKIFKEKHPNVRVHLIFDKLNILDDLRKSGKLDIVIKSKNDFIKEYTKIDDLELENFFIANKEAYPELENNYIPLKKLLTKYPLVIMSSVSPGRKNFDNFLKEKNINIKPTYEFNSYDLCKKIVDAGIGIGIDNPIDYDKNRYIIINTDRMNKRYFDIGYINNSNNKYINTFIEIYNDIKKEA